MRSAPGYFDFGHVRALIAVMFRWPSRHRRAVTIGAAATAAIALLAELELLGGTFVLLLWAWFALLGGSLFVGILQWLRRPDSRAQLRDLVRSSWRELLVAAVLAVVAGEVTRADDLGATILITLVAFLPFLAAVEQLVQRTRVGRFLHTLAPHYFLAAALLIYVLGPQFRREMPSEFCDPPNYWEETDYEESESGRVRSVSRCFDPDANDYVAPRIEGRSLFGLRLSNLALRIYSLDFTDGRFEGIGICTEESECFP